MATDFWGARILLASALIMCYDFGKCEPMKIFGLMNSNVTLPLHLKIGSLENQELKDITWKKEKDKIAEWQKNDVVSYFGPFQGRATLDWESGNLTILNLTTSDEGLYEIESINLPESETLYLYVLENPPLPNLSCSFEDGNITVSCNGSEDNRFLKYKWKFLGLYLNISKSKIQLNNSVDFHQSISCILWNPVSTSESSLFLQSCVPKENQRRHRYLIIGSCLFVIVLVALVCFFHVKNIR